METSSIVTALSAIAQESRLKVFRLLVQAGAIYATTQRSKRHDIILKKNGMTYSGIYLYGVYSRVFFRNVDK